jgi:membrane-associated phospholipid phosphatase
MGSYVFGSVVLICSLLIATATLFLRYHYAVDCLFGFVVAGVAFTIGCFTHEKLIEKEDESKQAKATLHNTSSTSTTTDEEKYLFANDDADV